MRGKVGLLNWWLVICQQNSTFPTLPSGLLLLACFFVSSPSSSSSFSSSSSSSQLSSQYSAILNNAIFAVITCKLATFHQTAAPCYLSDWILRKIPWSIQRSWVCTQDPKQQKNRPAVEVETAQHHMHSPSLISLNLKAWILLPVLPASNIMPNLSLPDSAPPVLMSSGFKTVAWKTQPRHKICLDKK